MRGRSMRLPVVVVIAVVLAVAGCSRRPGPPALVEYRDEQHGFALRLPDGWQPAEGTAEFETRFLPPGTAGDAEFITVLSLASPGGASETEIRRLVFGALPIHGVSGFQQDPRTTAEILWYKFEVTGSSGGTEWASVGVAAAGPARTQIAVCAKPLPQWREGQAQCDEVIRSFGPGDLATP